MVSQQCWPGQVGFVLQAENSSSSVGRLLFRDCPLWPLVDLLIYIDDFGLQLIESAEQNAHINHLLCTYERFKYGELLN